MCEVTFSSNVSMSGRGKFPPPPLLIFVAGLIIKSTQIKRDFPGGAVIKNPPANAADMGSRPGPGRSHIPQSN